MIGALSEAVMKALAEGNIDDVTLRRTQAMALVGQGALNLRMGDSERGQEEIRRAASLLEGLDALNERIIILPWLGLVAIFAGEHGVARRAIEEALRLATEIQDYSFKPLSRCNLAFHHYTQGNLELAEVGFDKGLVEAKRLDLFNSVWHSILGLGLVAAAEGQTSKAVTLLTFGLGQPGEYTGFLLGEPQRILADLRSTLPPEEFSAAEDQAREMELANLMAWL